MRRASAQLGEGEEKAGDEKHEVMITADETNLMGGIPLWCEHQHCIGIDISVIGALHLSALTQSNYVIPRSDSSQEDC